jgi:hypothetical protein
MYEHDLDSEYFITIARACEIIGGDKPINKATYWRGSKKGLWPKPDHLGGIARVRKHLLMEAIARLIGETTDDELGAK